MLEANKLDLLVVPHSQEFTVTATSADGTVEEEITPCYIVMIERLDLRYDMSAQQELFGNHLT